MKTVREAILHGSEMLSSTSVASPKLDSEVFLSELLEKDRLYLITHGSDFIDDEAFQSFEEMLALRAEGIPLAYILNKQEFMSLDFYVDESVLIPRPDTEILVEETISIARDIKDVTIMDLGCGSGAISVSLAYYLKQASIIAVDIDSIAAQITGFNAERNGVFNQLTILNKDMFELPQMEVDILVSNPPYIPSKDISDLQIEVSTYEPKLALDGGADGLDFYRKLVDMAPEFVKSGGYVIFEIGHDQGSALIELFNLDNRYNNDVQIVKDLAGLDRVVIAKVV